MCNTKRGAASYTALTIKQKGIMKTSLRERIERMRMDMVNRIEQLHKHIEEYKSVDDFQNAMKCDIKVSQLIIVLEGLEEALKY